MAINKSANAILSREWRLFKPLAWMVFVGLALLAGVAGAGAVRGTPRTPALVVLHADEQTATDQVAVTLLDVAPETIPTWKFVAGIRIDLAEGAQFSHPVTLNFPGSPQAAFAVFRGSGDSWVPVELSPGSQAGVAARATTAVEGTYILMDASGQIDGSQ